jgi:catechol 2,3-dioxygenase-like lactoylglutathione lyase family enzyme
MINGGNATVFVSDMDRAVDFYVNVLGLTLRYRAENYWAEVVAGNELVIGLHPTGDDGVQPGIAGSIQIGLGLAGPIQDAVDVLKAKGVEFCGGVVDDGPVKLAHFHDPDGNELYLAQVMHAAS